MNTFTDYKAHVDQRMFAPWRKSLFIYPGAKSSKTTKSTILAALPQRFREYREPFVGGGSIAMSIPLGVRRWINDIDTALIAVYRAVQERPDSFIARLRSLVSRDIDTNRAMFDRLLWNDDEDLAVRYLFLNRFAYNGRVRLTGPWRYRTTFSEERGYAYFETTRLEDAAEAIRDMRITTGDYATLLREDGDDVIVFVDAPYVAELQTRLKVHPSSQWYHHSFPSVEDHYKLRDEVFASPHKVLLTYDDQPLIRHLYADASRFNVSQIDWKYRRKRVGREIIIRNY
ncbi:MAG TPA: DNA adenine methylase [Tepidisphaeraceae bacterium]|nr:DNA adenine methylase [Tepidisphaeraceae bacterium]